MSPLLEAVWREVAAARNREAAGANLSASSATE
jgi:hypothetical protein